MRVLALGFLLLSHAWASETDPYFAWGRGLDDGTAVLGARVNQIISRELGRVNQGRPETLGCRAVAERLASKLRRDSFFLEFVPDHFSALDRVPRGSVERSDYSRYSIYGVHRVADLFRWLPIAPTIQLDGVRLGIDKLSLIHI